MNPGIRLLLREIQLKPELGLNREKALNSARILLNYSKKGGKNKMNVKRLSLALGAALCLTVLAVMATPVSAGYIWENWPTGGAQWSITTWVSVYYNDQTYIIDKAASNEFADASIFVGGQCIWNSYSITETDVNAQAYIKATFNWFGDQWRYESQSWAYPSYWSDPSGGYCRTW